MRFIVRVGDPPKYLDSSEIPKPSQEDLDKACDIIVEKLEELKNRMLSGEYLRRN